MSFFNKDKLKALAENAKAGLASAQGQLQQNLQRRTSSREGGEGPSMTGPLPPPPDSGLSSLSPDEAVHLLQSQVRAREDGVDAGACCR